MQGAKAPVDRIVNHIKRFGPLSTTQLATTFDLRNHSLVTILSKCSQVVCQRSEVKGNPMMWSYVEEAVNATHS